jgi:hypothetical protein
MPQSVKYAFFYSSNFGQAGVALTVNNWTGIRFRGGARIFLRAITSMLASQSDEYHGLFAAGVRSQSMKLISHLHPVLKLRLHGAIPKFPHTFS